MAADISMGIRELLKIDQRGILPRMWVEWLD